MSCCGHKRSALSQPPAPGRPGPATVPGRLRSSVAAGMLAFLARKAMTGTGPRINPPRSR
jgi:hypothetical protein